MSINKKSTAIDKIKLAAFAVSVTLGVITSPAFTFGTLVRSRTSAMIASAATLIWAVIRWRVRSLDSHYHPDNGPVHQALAIRMQDVVLSAVIFDAIVFTACCFIAGIATRWIFDNHRQASIPAAVAMIACSFIVMGQAGLYSANVNLAHAQGIESGRIRTLVEERHVSNEIMEQLAQDDREKLLLGYAARLTAYRSLGVATPAPDFDDYVHEIAEGCVGLGEEVPICNNQALKTIGRPL